MMAPLKAPKMNMCSPIPCRSQFPCFKQCETQRGIIFANIRRWLTQNLPPAEIEHTQTLCALALHAPQRSRRTEQEANHGAGGAASHASCYSGLLPVAEHEGLAGTGHETEDV